jgi:hypothetical protein
MPLTGHREYDRAELVDRAHRIKWEIIQYFRDIAYWNRHILPPGEPPIDPDPDGEMARCLEFCERTILGEMFAD